MQRRTRPTFVINPALIKPCWQGEVWGFHVFRNSSYLNSLYLGTVWNFLCLPQRLWFEVGSPLVRGRLLQAVDGLAWYFPLAWLVLRAGVEGRLVMLPMPLEVVANARILDESEARRAVQAGDIHPVRPG